MAPETLGAVIGATFTGATAFVVALSGLRRSRNAQLREDLQECYAQSQSTQRKHLASLGHMGRLEEMLAYHGIAVPMRPSILDVDRTDGRPSEWRPRHAAT